MPACGRYNRAVPGRSYSRRRFLKALTIVAAAGFTPPAPPTPPPAATPVARPPSLPLNPSTTEPRQYFVPVTDYHELPASSYAQNLIQPLEIILHWDGNQHGRPLWLAPVTFETLSYVQQSSHFAVDYKQVWQLLPMYRTVVQQSYGAQGFNWESINIEMAGTDFDQPGNLPPEAEVRRTLQLVSLLMDYYAIAFEHVAGHYERDPRGTKRDPGVKFLASFRERLVAYRAARSPNKMQFWTKET